MHGVHHGVQGRVQEGLGLFGIEAADEFGGVLEVGKQHRDLLALACQGAFGGEDFPREIAGDVGQQRMLLRGDGWCGSQSRGASGADPDQDIAPLINCHTLALDEFVLHIVQGCVVELKLALEGAVGQASAPLEHGDRLIENLLKGHRPPSLCQ